MTEKTDTDCVSKKPWREVINRTLKISFFNFGKEGGKSLGKLILWIIAGIIVVTAGIWFRNSIFDLVSAPFTAVGDWFGNIDLWPFGGGEEEIVNQEPVAEPPTGAGPEGDEKEPGAICSRWTKWNPFC